MNIEPVKPLGTSGHHRWRRRGGDDERVRGFTAPDLQSLGQASLMITHPLGGATIGPLSADSAPANNDKLLVFDPNRKCPGVVDEFGRVYDVTKRGTARPFYEGLYVADASVIPTSLGVNPSLTISALALRIAVGRP